MADRNRSRGRAIVALAWGACMSLAAEARELSVSGVADASLRIIFSVKFIALDCRSFNPLTRSSTQKVRQFNHEVDNTRGRYELRLPLALAPGLFGCQWRPLEIGTAVIRRSAPAGTEPELFRSLIAVDKPDGATTAHIDLGCRSALTARGDRSPHQLSCWAQDEVPSLRKTIAPEQRALQVNFMLAAE